MKAMVLFSGGLDSFTVLHRAINECSHVQAISIQYGQKHIKELYSAMEICDALGVTHKVVDIRSVGLLLTSALTDNKTKVPEGHYADVSMAATVVPNRNMIMLSIAAGVAAARGYDLVYCGVHAGDHAIYPDCRPEFIEAMNRTLQHAHYVPVSIRAPFLFQTKADILRWGIGQGLDYSQTWTCYNGREKACGKCGACNERLAAFAANNTADPIAYE